MKLKGKVAIITGAGRGMGRGVFLRLASSFSRSRPSATDGEKKKAEFFQDFRFEPVLDAPFLAVASASASGSF